MAALRAAEEMKPDLSMAEVDTYPSVHYRTEGPYFHTVLEPVSTFYKDDRPKRDNIIIWTVELRRKKTLGNRKKMLPVELKLFLEGNEPVHESSCKNYIQFHECKEMKDPPYIFPLDTSKESITFKFRLEKVSSKCENKKFYLKLSGKCDELQHVETLESRRIHVKSKRSKQKLEQRELEEQQKLKRKRDRSQGGEDSDSGTESYDAASLVKRTAHISNSDRVSHSSDLMNGLNAKLKAFEAATEKLHDDIVNQNEKISKLMDYIIGSDMQAPERLHTFQVQ